MSSNHRSELIQRLTDARISNRAVDMDELSCPLDDAQDLQLEVLEVLEQRGFSVSGWKVGLTSGHAYDLMGEGVRPIGFILQERTLQSGGRLSLPVGPPMLIEPELCLELGAPLSGENLSPEECRAAVKCVKAAFEINQSRVKMPGSNHLFVADGLANWGLVIGHGQRPDDAPLTPTVELFRDGRSICSSAPEIVMDDPFVSLSRLCSRLSRYGRGVAAGQHVITGAFFRQPLDAPGEYKAVFSGLGQVSFEID